MGDLRDRRRPRSRGPDRQVWRFSFFVPNIISMMGLAVGIDYSLFIVSRYREERKRGRDKLEAIGRPAQRRTGPCSSAA